LTDKENVGMIDPEDLGNYDSEDVQEVFPDNEILGMI